jgi:hypothetical protein
MNHRDWQAHQGLIHRFGNKKFMKPTPRTTRESPVFEAYEGTDPILGLALVMLVAVLLLAIGLIARMSGWF